MDVADFFRAFSDLLDVPCVPTRVTQFSPQVQADQRHLELTSGPYSWNWPPCTIQAWGNALHDKYCPGPSVGLSYIDKVAGELPA